MNKPAANAAHEQLYNVIFRDLPDLRGLVDLVGMHPNVESSASLSAGVAALVRQVDAIWNQLEAVAEELRPKTAAPVEQEANTSTAA